MQARAVGADCPAHTHTDASPFALETAAEVLGLLLLVRLFPPSWSRSFKNHPLRDPGGLASISKLSPSALASGVYLELKLLVGLALPARTGQHGFTLVYDMPA